MSDDSSVPADETQIPSITPEDVDGADTTDSATIGADATAVQTLFERILPDPACRARVAEVLADTILLAHQIGANRWATTVGNQRHVRLNVGLYVVAEVGKNYIWLAVDAQALDPAALPRLERLHKWANPYYKSFQSAMGGYIRCHELDEVLPLLRDAAAQFATKCAQQTSRLRSQVSDAHVSGVVAYLCQVTGRELPDPEYDAADNPQQNRLPNVDRAAIEMAFGVFDRERRDTSYWQNWERDPTYRYVVRWNGQAYPVKEVVRIATGVMQFNTRQARHLLNQLGFAIETLRDTAQHIWLFQANPRYYNLAERVQSIQAGGLDDWMVTRYRDEMKAGDRVLLWQAGQEAGIYAVGELTGAPAEHTYPADEVPEWVSAPSGQPATVWRVPFNYSKVLAQPIRRPTLLEHPILQQMQVLRAPNGTNFKVTAEEWEALYEIIGRDPIGQPPRTTLNADYSLAQCAHDTGIDEAALTRWLRALHRKGQAILYGPPGTGKTFVAQHLARHLVSGGDGFVELVQFHPAYAYEDFIQGIRPQSLPDGMLTYPLVPGRFLDFCARAQATEELCVLIIDEINRANLARVFGELMYLLEYRDQALPLAGGGRLFIPSNVRIIGTMNTADRSIALVDHALRRRFAFFPLAPNYELLRRYHRATGFDVEGLIALLERINQKIADPHYAIGISFFLRTDLGTQLEDIWRMEIEPYLEEYFFDQAKTVSELRWENIRSRVQL